MSSTITIPTEQFNQLMAIVVKQSEQQKQDAYTDVMNNMSEFTEAGVLNFINSNEQYVKEHVNDVNLNKISVLQLAIHIMYHTVVLRLIELGADTTIINIFYGYNVNTDTIKALIKAGSIIPNDWVQYVKRYNYSKLKELLPILIDNGKNINEVYDDHTLLYHYSNRMNNDCVHFLIDNGAEIIVNSVSQIDKNVMMYQYIDYYRIKHNIIPLFEVNISEDVAVVSYIVVNGTKYNLVQQK